ncbi:hypothetical protein OROGR_027631 [Orobanche gracilis]
MGYLLKEALKTLCGVNQWAYAVFWKIGSQNPKHLIWEECYYEALSYSGLPGFSGNGNLVFDFQDYDTSSSVTAGNLNLRSHIPAGDKVHTLVNKMMADSDVKIIGEGLVGRAAFAGNYQWILSENYYRESHPPEVLKEIYQQFLAGMQTVAVIPVLPHGVVQLGSYLKIAENVGFVNAAVSLVLQLGHIPGILLPENDPLHTGYSTPRQLPLESNTVDASSFLTNNPNSVGCPAQTSFVFNSQSSFALPGKNDMHSGVASFQASNSSLSHLEPHEGRMGRAEKMDFTLENQSKNGAVKAEVIFPSNPSEKLNFSKTATFLGSVDCLTTKNVIRAYDVDNRKHKIEHDACMIKSRSGEDLFDVFGADFKNEMFNSRSINESENVSSSEICSSDLDSAFLSFMDSDHLLDAVVSKIHPNKSLDESVSCRTTLAVTGSSSGSKASLPYGCFGDLDHMEGELLAIPDFLSKGKEDSINYSQGSSCVYDPWIEKCYNSRQNNSLATGCSNKPQRMSKTNRKRLKPGQNPRPRPKDRQMIQDRVKELREIVPNTAKCSIDALLERTIKHMLFLQGVTNHADKLKQISESSKIMGKDNSGGRGGATWGYEVGSRSTVCPIIVEDLNQPHQMLVEMLCEGGSFLEIAAIIRGLGLTILKGLMENRNDKIWARFTVEANRNVSRMEIFLALVPLLDQNAKPEPNSNNDNMIVQEFHKSASIPATGGPIGIC